MPTYRHKNSSMSIEEEREAYLLFLCGFSQTLIGEKYHVNRKTIVRALERFPERMQKLDVDSAIKIIKENF